MSFEPVYIIDGARSPFLKARNAPGPFSASDLAVQSGRALLLRQTFSPERLSEVILGCAAASPDETNIGRVVALRLGCGNAVPAWTVMRNCASGMQALDSALVNIQTGRSDLVLAGGVDALSRAPLLVSDEMTAWLAQWYSARSKRAKWQAIRRFKLGMLKPVIGLLKGLTDPVVGMTMGQTAEELASKFDISREDMDRYALLSHERAAQAQAGDSGETCVPLVALNGQRFDKDDGIRVDGSMDKLGKLKPVFDKPYGNVTAGNSSQVTDGAAWLILASANAVTELGLRPIGRIVDAQWAGLDPAQMGLGPVHAATPILLRHGLGLNDLDLWEINEAFAAQVLACQAAWASEDYCRTHFRVPALGQLDTARLNVDGGAIALGHPVGASGARIVLHMVAALRARQLKRGLAAICIGGGQGGAMLIEAVDGVSP